MSFIFKNWSLGNLIQMLQQRFIQIYSGRPGTNSQILGSLKQYNFTNIIDETIITK